jgi:hypothetical protein
LDVLQSSDPDWSATAHKRAKHRIEGCTMRLIEMCNSTDLNVMAKATEALKPFKVTASDYALLRTIRDSKFVTTSKYKQLTGKILHTNHNSHLWRKDGLIHRNIPSEGRRLHVYVLTSTGRELLKQIATKYKE